MSNGEDKRPAQFSVQERTGSDGSLARLSSGSWGLWRWAALRGAGFPVKLLLGLSASSCAVAADEMNEAQERERLAREAAISAARQAAYEAGRRSLSKEKAFKLLREPEQASSIKSNPAVRAAAAAWEKRRDEFETAQRNFRDQFQAAARQGSREIEAIARRRDFREAIAWQNRHALQTAIDPLLRQGSGEARNSKRRQHEQLVANYLQRYCAKNDTIGFFGPVGWARFVEDGPRLSVCPGPSIIARRNLYFESWCMDALVENFGGGREALACVAPRRNCAMYEMDGEIVLPFRKPLRLSPKEQALLAACDGRTAAGSIAAALARKPGAAFYAAAEVYDLLESMQSRGMIWWKFELPRVLRPEAALRKAIDNIGQAHWQAPLGEALDELEAAFIKVGRAAGDADELSDRLAELETAFQRITGKPATRAAGQIYAGRTLVYEDCMRDAQVEIGPKLLREIEPALTLVLDSARWLSYFVSEIYRKVLRNVYVSLAKAKASPRIDFVRYWAQIQFYFFEGREEIAQVARTQLQKRWAKILTPSSEQSRLHFSSDAICETVAKGFVVPKRLGSFARYQCPDLLFASTSIDSLKAGDYEAVLGELHAGINTLGCPLFIEQHPSPADLYRAIDLDQPEPRLVPIAPKGLFGDVTRVLPLMATPRDYYLIFQAGAYDIDESRSIPIGSLVVEESDGELTLKTRDGRVTIDLIEGLGRFLEIVAANQFKMFPLESHQPRITIDRLVVCREAWSFALDELKFADWKQEADRFSETRKWAVENRLPRFVFVRLPGEDKPVYIDFHSPVYIEILARMIRRAAAGGGEEKGSLILTEMLPGIDRNWLPDAAGDVYTCELRVVAVDLSSTLSIS